jgi:hypothetical protein
MILSVLISEVALAVHCFIIVSLGGFSELILAWWLYEVSGAVCTTRACIVHQQTVCWDLTDLHSASHSSAGS